MSFEESDIITVGTSGEPERGIPSVRYARSTVSRTAEAEEASTTLRGAGATDALEWLDLPDCASVPELYGVWCGVAPCRQE